MSPSASDPQSVHLSRAGSTSSICILSLENTYYQFAGNAAYLHSTASALAGQGIRLVLLIADLPTGKRLRFRIDRTWTSPYAEIHVRGYARMGDLFLCTSPRFLAGMAAGKLRGVLARLGRLFPARAVPPEKPYMWLLQKPSAAAEAWAHGRLRRLRPRAVIANYFNAAEIFPGIGPDITRAVLIHDVMNRRAETMAAAGKASDLHPDMLTRELPALGHADILFAIQAEEGAWLRDRYPRAQVIDAPFAIALPDAGADTTDVAALPVVTFIGAWNEPNCDALNWLLDDIWPRVCAARPDARLQVVGTVGKSRDRWPAGAIARGVVPSLEQVYRETGIALAPIRFGSGLKIKLVEALAAGVPVVATSSAVEGLPAVRPDVVRIADEAEAFAAQIVAALAERDPAHIRRMARDYADANFSSQVVGARLAAALLA